MTDLTNPPGLTPEQRARFLRVSDVNWIMEVVAGAIREVREPLLKRIEALERGHALPAKQALKSDALIKSVLDAQQRKLIARVETLERQSSQMRYAGVWSEKRNYSQGEFVTHSGSMWHADRRSVGSKPGTDAGNWTLAVKRGQDGRGA